MDWRYDDEDSLVRDVKGSDPTGDRVVCWVNGTFNHGPRIALAPRMEALIRKMDAYRRAVASPCDCAECREIAAIVRDLDEARPKEGS